MSKTTIKLLKLIQEGKALNEICTELQKSPKQIFNHLTMLKNKGFLFSRKYLYYGGKIVYSPQTDFSFENCKYDPLLITPQNCSRIKAIAIADTHIGSNYERLDLLNEIYNYCAKNGITTIFHCGDIIDNIVLEGKVPKEERVDYLLKNYPYDKNILTFNIFGNHDISILKELNQNLQVLLENYRHDLVNLGYMQGILKVKNDTITLYHPFSSNSYIFDKGNQSSIILQGHSHKFQIENKLNRDNLNIKVPPLCDISISKFSYPSVLELDIFFEDGIINYIFINQLMYQDNKFTPINELKYAIDNKEKKQRIKKI